MNLSLNNKGFTLVETLVAIAIFATSVTGLISITARGINDNVYVKNKLLASYLSQEGVELVRNMRDNSILSQVSWAQFLASPDWVGNCYDTFNNDVNACYIDGSVSQVTAESCVNGVCATPLSLDPVSSRYTYYSIYPSPFTRTITIRPISSGNNEEVLVNSIVEWKQGTRTHQVSYQYNLLNWFNP
mgnify:CR=1 FL=1